MSSGRSCQVAVAGGEDADVDFSRPGATDGGELLFLDKAQELALHLQRQLADLVEEHCAGMGLGQSAGPSLMGAGVGPSFVAKKLALDQAGRNGAAVHYHHGPPFAGAELVNGPRQQLLAGSAAAGDENRGVGWCDPASGGHQRIHLRRSVDQLGLLQCLAQLVELCPQQSLLLLAAAGLELGQSCPVQSHGQLRGESLEKDQVRRFEIERGNTSEIRN
jgi:hypothetical protein